MSRTQEKARQRLYKQFAKTVEHACDEQVHELVPFLVIADQAIRVADRLDRVAGELREAREVLDTGVAEFQDVKALATEFFKMAPSMFAKMQPPQGGG